jgi:hypothetical protein
MPPGRRWKAPDGTGELLADPDLDAAAKLVSRRPESDARREVLAVATAYLRDRGEPVPEDTGGPLIVTGHQPDLFHPGVWAKNFAASGVARRAGGVALNLIADSDTLKSRTLRAPSVRGDTVRVEVIPFDAPAPETPYERAVPRDPRQFARAWETLHDLAKSWPFTPLLPAIHTARGEPFGETFSRARRGQEREWGCHNFELPVSRLCQTAAFAAFVAAIEARLPEFTAIYNAALTDYRRTYRVRSDRHPAPLLEPGERPFWRVTPGGRERPFRAFPAAELRPRALTLTLFARTTFADLFIHGIGGGLYDRATDAIARDFYGSPPPPYQVVTLTARLPFPASGNPAAELLHAQRAERARKWNPQDFVTDPTADAVRAAIAETPTTRRGRRERFDRIRHLKETLARRLGPPGDDAVTAAQTQVARAAVLTRRDYPWVLFPAETLRPLMTGLL